MSWRNLDPHTKYGNTPQRCYKNTLHHSKLEARRCDELNLLQRAGEISGLIDHPQPSYDLDVNGKRVCRYVADFEYLDRDGNVVTEDTKGFRTEVYKLKAALFEAIYGRQILETRGGGGRR